MRNFCDRRVRWPQARLIWLGWLWKSLAYAQKLGSGRPFEEVQVGHYLQARKSYYPNLPRLHQYPCQYSLSGSDVQPGDSASDDIWGSLKSRLDACGGIGCTDCRLFGSSCCWVIYLSNNYCRLPSRWTPKYAFSCLSWKIIQRGWEICVPCTSWSSFGCGLKEEDEIKVVNMGAITFAKQPLDDDALIRLPKIKRRDMLEFIRRGLVSVINPSFISIIGPLRTPFIFFATPRWIFWYPGSGPSWTSACYAGFKH